MNLSDMRFLQLQGLIIQEHLGKQSASLKLSYHPFPNNKKSLKSSALLIKSWSWRRSERRSWRGLRGD